MASASTGVAAAATATTETSSARQHGNPQGSVKPFEPVGGPGAWVAADYKTNEAWIYRLTAEDVQELEAAVQSVIDSGIRIQDVRRGDVQLPRLEQRLLAIRSEVIRGRGFQVIKGVPVERWSRQQSVIAYWIIGTFFGKAVSNNKKGHLVGHIKDIGHDPTKPTTRLYATHEAQPFHNDSSDIVGLLCLHNAKEGGHSSWTSSVSVHNRILELAPDLARTLAQRGAWYFDRKGEIPEKSNGKDFFELPVFSYHDGYLSTNISTNYFFSSQRHAEVPRLTQPQLDAIKLFNQLAAANDLRMDAVLEPGDIQLLNNHTILHARTAFVDYEESEKKRHLLRLWLSPDDDRPLPDYYAELLGGSVEIGNRGGINVRGNQLKITLDAE